MGDRNPLIIFRMHFERLMFPCSASWLICDIKTCWGVSVLACIQCHCAVPSVIGEVNHYWVHAEVRVAQAMLHFKVKHNAIDYISEALTMFYLIALWVSHITWPDKPPPYLAEHSSHYMLMVKRARTFTRRTDGASARFIITHLGWSLA